MLRSLYSGISGMKVNQTKLDVIGNNIANVGTTAFKSAKVRFQDMLSQNVSQALAPGVNQGGINPKQVGLGVQIAGIDTLVSQGMMQPTSRNLDVAIDGEGYFMVGSGQLPFNNSRAVTLNGSEIVDTNGMNISYTRDGSFTLDTDGNLITSDGYRVMGYAVKANGSEESVKYVNGRVDSINYVNANDLSIVASDTIVPLVIPDSVKMPASNFETATALKASSGEATADQSPTIVNTTDGTPYSGKTAIIQVKFTKGTGSNPDAWEYFINGESQGTIPAGGTVNLDGGVTIKVPAAGNNPNADTMWTQNLYKQGDPSRITTFNIGKDGAISAVLEGGEVTVLGQIAMATFKNAAGLTKLGKNLYEKSANSGEPIVRSGINASVDNSKAYGDMLQGVLEMSNVDLSEQFTDMIVTSRAFQANSKTITTGDEILQEILNLKR
ncbi:flagellar hook-basal body complex protein [Clostridium sp. SYSU_GA19001]|uniref:flagellar hook protein FlgE n=1 Tax=Clostridium caldaquaticum TaxID=2940653 RepID=UPI002077615B|nr:flagellar hook-basal body complex protein [Clostridium caldaquaticum]MCM8710977.1 flagellar hook-basal body complex protein [Clostridium caldaquaticum]